MLIANCLFLYKAVLVPNEIKSWIMSYLTATPIKFCRYPIIIVKKAKNGFGELFKYSQ